MNAKDPVVRNGLGDVIATAAMRDSRLEFRRQLGTGDLWCIGIGPLATIAVPLLPGNAVARADRLAGQRSRARYAKWQRVRIDDDLLIAFRARGSDLEFAYLFGDGAPFGGGGGWLPTAQRATLLERAQMWLSGRRGGRIEFARRTDEGGR
jgi:hypothetical protein